jgi:hypothetical protein
LNERSAVSSHFLFLSIVLDVPVVKVINVNQSQKDDQKREGERRREKKEPENEESEENILRDIHPS